MPDVNHVLQLVNYLLNNGPLDILAYALTNVTLTIVAQAIITFDIVASAAGYDHSCYIRLSVNSKV